MNMCRPDAAFRILVCLWTSRAWEGGSREGQEAGWVRPCKGDLHTLECVIHRVGGPRGAKMDFE